MNKNNNLYKRNLKTLFNNKLLIKKTIKLLMDIKCDIIMILFCINNYFKCEHFNFKYK
jgi:hypothetical protein